MTEQRTEDAREREIERLMEENPSFSRESAEWCVRLGEARRRVEELSVEERGRGARLGGRYWALVDALHDLRGTKPFLSEKQKQDVLGTLEDLKEEIGQEFRGFQEEHSIPKVG